MSIQDDESDFPTIRTDVSNWNRTEKPQSVSEWQPQVDLPKLVAPPSFEREDLRFVSMNPVGEVEEANER
jgi:hypothetical protein